MKKKSYIGMVLIGAAMSVGMTSCGVTTKTYKAPEVNAEGLYRDEQPTDTATIANIPWHEYFADPTLQSLIQEGLAANYDLRIAVSRIREAEAGLQMARAAYFPTVGLSAIAEHSRQSAGSSILKNHQNQFTLGVAVTWEAEIWGKMSSQSRAKYAQFLSSYSYKNLIQTSLIANIANSYYSLLALDEQLQITTETAKLLQESADSMKEMMEAGMLNGAAVQQSLGLLYSTQTAIPDLESQIRKLENSLSVLLGRKPGSITRSTLKVQSVPTELSHGVPMQMLANRPDVQQAELAFRAAFEATNVARASFYPSITLNTGTMAGYSATTLSQFFEPRNIIANIIGGLTQPIFAKRQLTGNLKVAKAQQEQALYSFEQSVLSAGQEVSDILYTYESSVKKNTTRSKQVEALSTAVYYTQELLRAGEANYTEVLSAQQNLLQAQLSQVSDKLEQLQATVNLYRSLGGGSEAGRPGFHADGKAW